MRTWRPAGNPYLSPVSVIRVSQVVHGLWMGGLEMLVVQLCAATRRLGVSPCVIALERGGPLSAFDVYAQPSRREGRSLAMLEAMAAGLPMVSHALPAIEEVHRDGETAQAPA